MLQYLASMDPRFAIAILAACALALRIRLPVLAGVVAALTINWIASTALTYATFDPAHPWAARPWLVYATVDYLSGLTIVLFLSGRPAWRAVIGLTYAAMLVRHASYGIGAQVEWLAYYYDVALGRLAWAQLALILLWSAHEMAGRPRIIARIVPRRLHRYIPFAAQSRETEA